MSGINCPHCKSEFKRQHNLNVHIKDRCPVLKATIAMSLVRVGRSEEREENGGTKKRSKSPRHYEDEDVNEITEATEFQRATTNDVFQRLIDGTLPDFKAAYSFQDANVQALLMDKYLKERLVYNRKKREFEDFEARFKAIDQGFSQLTSTTKQCCYY